MMGSMKTPAPLTWVKAIRIAAVGLVLAAVPNCIRAHELDVKRLCKRGFRVGTADEFPPYVFIRKSKDHSVIVGLDVDVVIKVRAALCKESPSVAKARILFVNIPDIDDLFDSLRRRAVDMAIGGFSTAEPVKGRDGLAYSHPYARSAIVLAFRKGSEAERVLGGIQERDELICALRRLDTPVSVEKDSHMESILKDGEYLQVQSAESFALQSPSGDVVAIDEYQPPYLSGGLVEWSTGAMTAPLARGGVSIVFREKDYALMRSVNKVIDSLEVSSSPGSGYRGNGLLDRWTGQWAADTRERNATLEVRLRDEGLPVNRIEELSRLEQWKIRGRRLSIGVTAPAFTYETGEPSGFHRTTYKAEVSIRSPVYLSFVGPIVITEFGPGAGYSRTRQTQADSQGIYKNDTWDVNLGAQFRILWFPERYKPTLLLGIGNSREQRYGAPPPAKTSEAITKLTLDIPLAFFLEHRFAKAELIGSFEIKKVFFSGPTRLTQFGLSVPLHFDFTDAQ